MTPRPIIPAPTDPLREATGVCTAVVIGAVGWAAIIAVAIWIFA